MKNYYSINIENLVDQSLLIWNKVKNDKDETNEYVKRSYAASNTFWQIKVNTAMPECQELRNKFLKITPEKCTMDFYLGSAKNYISSPHIDRGRRIGLNIPIQVDLELSSTYFGRYTDLSKYEHTRTQRQFISTATDRNGNPIKNSNPHFMGSWDPDLYDVVRLESPVVFNSGMPHGGFNTGPDTRVLMSLSWVDTMFSDFVSKSKELEYIVE